MEAARPPGRPRDPAVDRAILAAARDLIVKTGYGSTTIEAVARRAGVGRPTIYRRWANKAELVFDALFEATETIPVPETGDLVTDLRAVARTVAADLMSPAAAQALVAVMAELGADSESAIKLREETIQPRVDEFALMVERAQDRGSARRDVDAGLVLHAIAGVLYYHATVLGRAITDDLLEAVIALLVGGLEPARTVDGPTRGARP